MSGEGARTRLLDRVRRTAFLDEVIRERPGRRFVARYEMRVAERGRSWRASRMILALVLFMTGMLNVFIPGPGGSVFIFASAAVLSGESRRFAALLDRAELRFSRQVRWMLAHPILVSTAITATVLMALLAAGRWLSG